MKMPEFSDSDSDFETIPPKKHQCIDSTTPDDGSNMSNLTSRMETLEKQSLVHLEEQDKLKKTITTLESEKARLKASN